MQEINDYFFNPHVHVCIGSGRYCTNVLRVQSESVLQPLYIKLKVVPKKTGGGRRGPLPTGLLLVLSFLTDISMSAAFGCNSLVIAICLYGHCSNDTHFLHLV